MSQKSKSGGKPKKVSKPAPAKSKVVSKPKTAVKVAPAPAKVSSKAIKSKPISNGTEDHEPVRPVVRLPRDAKTLAFFSRQKARLLDLRDHFLDQMQSVAQDSLRSRAENNEASAVGQHQADAGSDAYEKDFALSLLSQEQDALYEIDQALKRIELGTYGTCEMSGKPIPRARLEAIPFARFTVECQSQLEKQNKASRVRQSVTSLFGLTEEEEAPETEEEQPAPAAEKE